MSLSVAVIGDIVQYLSHCITVLPMPVLILSILFMSNGLMVYWPVGYMGRKTQYNTMHGMGKHSMGISFAEFDSIAIAFFSSLSV